MPEPYAGLEGDMQAGCPHSSWENTSMVRLHLYPAFEGQRRSHLDVDRMFAQRRRRKRNISHGAHTCARRSYHGAEHRYHTKLRHAQCASIREYSIQRTQSNKIAGRGEYRAPVEASTTEAVT